MRIAAGLPVDDLNPMTLPGLGRLTKTDRHILLLTDSPMRATGSSVWHGGSAQVQGWLNLKVSGHDDINESPAETLQQYARHLNIEAPLTGMMTAASMNSLRVELRGNEQIKLACIVTAGIENARRAGDPCDVEQTMPDFGTINIALIGNQPLTPAAGIEALMLATEAKTAACYDLAITSPVSGKTATGTGTDSICILHPDGDDLIPYCGKHTQLGEWIGAATYAAVFSSLHACVSLRQ